MRVKYCRRQEGGAGSSSLAVVVIKLSRMGGNAAVSSIALRRNDPGEL